jgi:hypothetical protein
MHSVSHQISENIRGTEETSRHIDRANVMPRDPVVGQSYFLCHNVTAGRVTGCEHATPEVLLPSNAHVPLVVSHAL